MTAGKISRVVVHPDGALVTRIGRFEANDGRVEIRQLPLLLDPTTVRAAVAGAPVRGLRVELDVEGEDRGPKPKIHEEWTEARDRIHHLDASIVATAEVKSVLPAADPHANNGHAAPGHAAPTSAAGRSIRGPAHDAAASASVSTTRRTVPLAEGRADMSNN